MERVLGYYESYCKHLYEKYHGDGTVLTIALVSGRLTPNIVLEGLNQLQRRHPLLQSFISETGPRENSFKFTRYSSLSSEEKKGKIPLTVIEREGSEQWKVLAETILNEPIEKFTEYLWRFVYLCSGESNENELFLYSRHDISDARSTNHLMNDLIMYCSSYSENTELNLPLLPLLPSIEKQLSRKNRAEVAEDPCNPESSICDWPYLDYSEVSERKAVCVFYKVNENEFNAFKQATKLHGVTINSALATALMLAQKSIYHPSEEIRLRINTAISLREYCEPVLSYEHFGCYVMNVSTTHVLAPVNEFWSLAKTYGEELLSTIEHVKASDFLPIGCDYQEVVSAVDNDALIIAEKKAFLTPMITNSGLLKFPKTHKSITLNGLYVGTKQVFGDCGMVLSTLTLNGEMFFMFSGCEPLFSKDRMNEIVDSLFALIKAECEMI